MESEVSWRRVQEFHPGRNLMNRWKSKLKESVKLLVCLTVAFSALQLTSCDEEDNPASGPECGTGNVQWDAKAGVCRDLGRNNTIVPSSCCGR